MTRLWLLVVAVVVLLLVAIPAPYVRRSAPRSRRELVDVGPPVGSRDRHLPGKARIRARRA